MLSQVSRGQLFFTFVSIIHSQLLPTTMKTEFHLHRAAQNISPWRLIMFWDWFLRKHWNADPFKLLLLLWWFSAPSIMNCTVRDMTNGFFSLSFVAAFEMLKYLRGPESTQGRKNRKEKKGATRFCMLGRADSRAVDVGWAKNTSRTCKKDEWRSVIIYSYWRLRGSLRVDVWKTHIWVSCWHVV